MWSNTHSFYKSDLWRNLRTQLMSEREDDNGDIICEYCHKPILNRESCIAHHTIMLNDENVNDYDISLNPERIQLVHMRCHNKIHNRFGAFNQHRYIVYGAPCSGKKTFVKENATRDDIVISMDLLNEAITGGLMLDNSNNTRGEVFAVRDFLLQRLTNNRAMRKAHNIFIIGGYPRDAELQYDCNLYQAEPIFINTNKDECLLRLESMTGVDKIAYRKYIEDWFFEHNY